MAFFGKSKQEDQTPERTLSQLRMDLKDLFGEVETRLELLSDVGGKIFREITYLREKNADLQREVDACSMLAQQTETMRIEEAKRAAYWYGQYLVVSKTLRDIAVMSQNARSDAENIEIPFDPPPTILQHQQVDDNSLLPSERVESIAQQLEDDIGTLSGDDFRQQPIDDTTFNQPEIDVEALPEQPLPPRESDRTDAPSRMPDVRFETGPITHPRPPVWDDTEKRWIEREPPNDDEPRSLAERFTGAFRGM